MCKSAREVPHFLIRTWVRLAKETITLPSIRRPRHSRNCLMPRVSFKLITLYFEMHHVRAYFLWDVMTFSYYVIFIHNMFIFKKKTYRGFCLSQNCQHGRCLSAEDKRWSGQIRDVFFRPIPHVEKRGKLSSWRLTRCEWTSRNMKKSWRHTEKKMSSLGALQCTTWLVWNKLAATKTILLRRQKNKTNLGCRGLMWRVVSAPYKQLIHAVNRNRHITDDKVYTSLAVNSIKAKLANNF